MGHSLSELGLDSNCLSYVIDALEGVAEPTDDLATQKIALVRFYLYTPGTLWTMTMVKQEFSRIPDLARRASHEKLDERTLRRAPPEQARIGEAAGSGPGALPPQARRLHGLGPR